MKTFISSYIFSIIPLAIIFYPSIQIEPAEALTRIFFYLGFPLAIVLSLAVIVIRYALGGDQGTLAESAIHRAADGSMGQSELKAS